MFNYESKVTARIDTDLYNKIQQRFHYGQQTKLFRNIFRSLETLIDEDRFDEVLEYLYRGEALTLPAIKEDHNGNGAQK